MIVLLELGQLVPPRVPELREPGTSQDVVIDSTGMVLSTEVVNTFIPYPWMNSISGLSFASLLTQCSLRIRRVPVDHIQLLMGMAPC